MIRIYGASDDLVEIDGHVREEINCYSKAVRIEVGDPTDPTTGGCIVWATYAPQEVFVAPGGTWLLAVTLFDEDVPLPWPVRLEVKECRYSPTLVIGCPTGTPVRWSVVK